MPGIEHTDNIRAIEALVARQFASPNWAPGTSADWPAFAADFFSKRYLTDRGLPADLRAVDRSVYLIGRIDDPYERLRAADRLHGTVWQQAADDSSNGQGALRPPAAGDGVKGTTLYKEIKAFFGRCVDALEAPDRKGAARLRAASTHWLRHLHATHSLARGLPL